MPETEVAAAELPEEVAGAIDELRRHYPTAEALLLPALHFAQKHWGGWLPEEAILAVAAELDLAPAKVLGVVTFYDLFHQSPIGRHRVRVCTNLSCALRGGQEILESVKRHLGVGENEVSADGRCSVAEFECLGACEQAPMMMVDDEYHPRLTPQSAAEILEGLD
ncbi:MAG: NAD(P)H-dependent oxidoreductase subunit E [bacterium]|nr:NAD(P)H-dependent oxidoreductase subunit E [bacterium]